MHDAGRRQAARSSGQAHCGCRNNPPASVKPGSRASNGKLATCSYRPSEREVHSIVQRERREQTGSARTEGKDLVRRCFQVKE